jgi:outer membrane protein OmpA-like peptidoglycan-associated protein
MRTPGHTLALLAICLVAFAAIAWADTEDGGSGLVRVDHAYSRPFGRPLINVWGGYFNKEVPPYEKRYFTLVPGLTLGLGLGFEASAVIDLDGVTTSADLGNFDRRFDVRTRDFGGKLRWTTRVLTDRVRLGAQGIIDSDFGDARRPGGTKDPQQEFDPGLVGLMSFDFSINQVLMRLSGNGGVWKSRNDGAVYFRDFPAPLSVPGLDPDDNDVWMGGVALEAGLRSATLFTEFTCEQLMMGGDYMSFREGYLRLTPGVRFALSKTIAMTAAVSADLSSNDTKTQFDPSEVYANAELRLGFSFGQVFGWTSGADQAAAAPAPNAVAAPPMDARIRDLDNRIRFLDMGMRLQDLERRVGPNAPTDSLWAAPLAGGAPDSSTTYQAELQQIRAEYDSLATELGVAHIGAATATTAAAGAGMAATGEKKELAQGIQEQSAAQKSQSGQKGSDGGSGGGSGAVSDGEEAAGAAVAAAAAAAGILAGVAKGNESAPPQAAAAGTESVAAAPAGATTQAGSAVASTATEASTSAAAAGAVAGTAVATTAVATASLAGTAATIPGSAGPTAAASQPRRIPIQAGAVRLLEEIDLADASSPLISADARAALDEVAEDLRAWPDAEILLIVHAGPAGNADAAERTEEEASQLRDYLLLSGAADHQVRALGMGRSVPIIDASGTALPTARVEIARIR